MQAESDDRDRRRIRGLIAATLLFSVVANALLLTGPLFMLQVYDRVLATQSVETLVALFALVAVLYLIYAVLDFSRARLLLRVANIWADRMSSTAFMEMLAGKHPTQVDGASSQADLDLIRTVGGSHAVQGLLDLPWTPLFLATLFLFHPLLGWFSVTALFVMVALSIGVHAITRRSSDKAAHFGSAAQRIEADAVLYRTEIATLSMAQSTFERWKAASEAAATSLCIVHDWVGAVGAVSKALRLLSQSAMLALGAWLVLRQEMTAGAMIAALVLLSRAMAPVDAILSQWSMLERARTAAARLRTSHDRQVLARHRSFLPSPKGQLRVENLSVSSGRSGRLILSQIGFSVRPGEVLGIIGSSGAGKSTLCRTILGVEPILSGSVRLDGAPVAQYGSNLGRYIGFLPQRPVLFAGTIWENIAQFDSDLADEAVVEVAHLVSAHQSILALPDGYDTQVGPGGAPLSAGEIQRIALARALVKKPVLVLLDDPFSGSDDRAGQDLIAVIEKLKEKEIAMLCATSRPNMAPFCDQLVVLEGGRVVSSGARDAVISGMTSRTALRQRVVRFGPRPA